MKNCSYNKRRNIMQETVRDDRLMFSLLVLELLKTFIKEVIQTPERPSGGEKSMNLRSCPLTSISGEIILKKSKKRNKHCYLMDMCMHCEHYYSPAQIFF